MRTITTGIAYVVASVVLAACSADPAPVEEAEESMSIEELESALAETFTDDSDVSVDDSSVGWDEPFSKAVTTRLGQRYSARAANRYADTVRNSARVNPESFSDMEVLDNQDLIEIGGGACDTLANGGDARDELVVVGYGLFEANIYVSAAEAFLC